MLLQLLANLLPIKAVVINTDQDIVDQGIASFTLYRSDLLLQLLRPHGQLIKLLAQVDVCDRGFVSVIGNASVFRHEMSPCCDKD